MPRVARVLEPGSLYHVISRFIDGRFELDDALRKRVLESAERVFERSDWKLVAYALMSNHVHWAVIAGESPSSDWTRRLNGRMAHAIQASRRSAGTALGAVFGHRPTEVLVENAAAARLIAYVHNNPVRAGVVHSADESSWTTHRAAIGLDAETIADVELGLAVAGFGCDAGSRSAFHDFVVAQASTAISFGSRGVAPIRAATRAVLAKPVELGGPRYEDGALRYEILTRAHANSGKSAGLDPSAVVEAASALIGVPVELTCSGDRRRPAVAARRLALLVARLGRIRNADVSSALGMSKSAAYELAATTDSQDPAHEAARSIWRVLSAQ